MKGSTKTSLGLVSVFIVLCSSVSWLASITAAPTPANDLYVTFDEEADLDHVCFYVTIRNDQDSDDSFPSKFLLNRTSIDIAKAETKLWEGEEYEYEVTHCKTCEIEDCVENNKTKEIECNTSNISNCEKCGSWSETRHKNRWIEKPLTNTERIIISEEKTAEKEHEKNELRNQFEEIQIKKGETKRYKLCYWFNEIPINPTTGMPGSYGYMYLDVKGKLHYDFENSSWWNTSYGYKRSLTQADGYADPFLAGDQPFTFCDSSTCWETEVWCDKDAAYMYYDNSTGTGFPLIQCVNSAEDGTVETQVVYNTSVANYGGNPFGSDRYSWVYHFHNTSGYDASEQAYTVAVGGAPALRTGKVGNAIWFDGIDDQFNYGDIDEGDGTAMTIMFWMKTTEVAAAGFQDPIGKKGVAPMWYVEPLVATHCLRCYWQDNSVDYLIPALTTPQNLNIWQHITFVLAGTNGYAYMNGTLEGSHSDAGMNSAASNYDFAVGRVAIAFANITMDEARFYNVTLNATQINATWCNMEPTCTYSTLGAEEIRAPQITIHSPDNKTYNNATIYLNWSADQTLDWIAYSLNGTGNVSLFHKEGEYIDSFDISGEISSPCGITQNGTYFWITDYDDDEVYQYHIDGTYANNHFDTNSSGNIVPFGITQNGTYFWITDTPTQTRMVYIYDMDGTPAGNFSTAAESCSPWGITQNGTYFWITDNGTGNTVYKYWMNGTYVDSFNTASENADAKGITQNGTYFWIVDLVDEKVYIYNMDGTPTGRSFSTTAANNEPFGITQNGTYIWITDLYDYSPVVYKYYENEEFFNTTITVQEGSHNITVCGNSTSGNMNCTMVYFTVDLTPPTISLTFPENNTRYNLTWINITGTASDNNSGTIRINTNFGTNLGNYTNWNFTNTSIAEGWYSLKITANDSGGNEQSVEVHFSVGTWNVTFNVTDSYSGVGLNAVTISCDYSGFNQSGDNDNTYGPYGFPTGDYDCNFVVSNYFDKSVSFTADDDKTIDVSMSEEAGMSIEEHTWLEWLYNCWYSEDCRQTLDRIETMVIYINQTTTQINETVNKVWNQFKQTDESVVLLEDRISSVVNSTSNITINYSIDVPEKENYKFLPIRLFYWFLNEDNTSCYSQGNYSVALVEPYCQPLVAHTIGEVNKILNFTVDMRPSLPAGNYTIVRRIDIDPNDIWINYGHEIIGRIVVLEDVDDVGVDLKIAGKGDESGEETETRASETESDGITGLAIGELFSPANLSIVISIITLSVVVYLAVMKRKQ